MDELLCMTYFPDSGMRWLFVFLPNEGLRLRNVQIGGKSPYGGNLDFAILLELFLTDEGDGVLDYFDFYKLALTSVGWIYCHLHILVFWLIFFTRLSMLLSFP